jgi:serine/threonine protein kinase
MADVYRAVDTRDDNRTVAVKILRSGVVGSDVLREIFKRETMSLGQLRHPHIVELVDHGIDDATGDYFVALEWVESTLQEDVRARPPDGWDTFAEEVAIPLLRALDLMHTRGICHRDIKPSNVLITANGTAKLADFGISKLRQCIDAGVTVREFVSRPYAPAEDDDQEHQFARDVYSFAAVCIFSLTDRALSTSADVRAALDVLDVPEEVRSVLRSALDPTHRPATRRSRIDDRV